MFIPATNSGAENNGSGNSNTCLHGSGRIIIMDDDEMIHNFLKPLLAHFGYNVDSVYDGTEALVFIKKP